MAKPWELITKNRVPANSQHATDKTLNSVDGCPNPQVHLTVEENVGALKWLRRSAVACAKNIEGIPYMRSHFDRDGISYCSPRSLGGKDFSINF